MASIFLNRVSNALIHTNKTAEGREFANVSVGNTASANGLMSFAVNCGQVLPCTAKDGTPVDGYSNILLGDGEKERTVSIATGKKKITYKSVKMTNQAIADAVKESRKAYRAAQAEAQAE